MKTLFAVLLALGCTAAGIAGEWQPMVSVGATGGAILKSRYVHRFWLPLEFEHLACISGPRIELGIRGPRHEWYIAHFAAQGGQEQSTYISSTFENITISSRGYYSDRYTERAILGGYRFHPVRGTQRVAPVLGAALVIGILERRATTSQYRREYAYYPDQHSDVPLRKPVQWTYKEYSSSQIRFGAAGEFGISYAAARDFDILLLAQLYWRLAMSPYKTWGSSISATGSGVPPSHVTVPGGIVQVRYTFKS